VKVWPNATAVPAGAAVDEPPPAGAVAPTEERSSPSWVKALATMTRPVMPSAIASTQAITPVAAVLVFVATRRQARVTPTRPSTRPTTPRRIAPTPKSGMRPTTRPHRPSTRPAMPRPLCGGTGGAIGAGATGPAVGAGAIGAGLTGVIAGPRPARAASSAARGIGMVSDSSAGDAAVGAGVDAAACDGAELRIRTKRGDTVIGPDGCGSRPKPWAPAGAR
jgi:hypothetical protein